MAEKVEMFRDLYGVLHQTEDRADDINAEILKRRSQLTVILQSNPEIRAMLIKVGTESIHDLAKFLDDNRQSFRTILS